MEANLSLYYLALKNCTKTLALKTRAKTFDDLPADVISYLLSFLPFDPKLLFVNRRFYHLYQKSFLIYGINTTKLEIRFLIQISDHDGYCSDAENEYFERQNSVLIPFSTPSFSLKELKTNVDEIIEEVKFFCDDLATANIYDDFDALSESNLYYAQLKHLIPNVSGDSYYCGNSTESGQHGLKAHDYRISIIGYQCI